MTISVTSTHHALMVAWARHDIEALTGPTPSRERAGRVLREWHSYAGMTGAEIGDVLYAYYPEEPEPVADPDPWCEIVADSKAVVDAMLAEDLRVKPKTDWSRYGACPACGAGAGRVCVFVAISNRWGEPRNTPHEERPPVEVTDEPTPAPEVWDDSVPPGGFVCSVCRTPVESEPCPEHGEKVTDEPTAVAS